MAAVMALPTVPTAVLSAVAPHEMGKASGINYMAQRFGAVFAVAIGNVTTFLMSGAIFAAGLFVTEEFQLARHYSPVSAGAHLLPFFATPMLISPIAGALSDRIGRRPIMVTGLSMLTAGFVWVAWHGSFYTSGSNS